MLPNSRCNDIVQRFTHMGLEIDMEKFNAKSFANKLIAEHMERLEVDAQKIRTAHKISQGDATLV